MFFVCINFHWIPLIYAGSCLNKLFTKKCFYSQGFNHWFNIFIWYISFAQDGWSKTSRETILFIMVTANKSFEKSFQKKVLKFPTKKVPGIKTQDFISSDIFSNDLRKFGLFSKFFISRFFFPETFFSGLSYKDSKFLPLKNVGHPVLEWIKPVLCLKYLYIYFRIIQENVQSLELNCLENL